MSQATVPQEANATGAPISVDDIVVSTELMARPPKQANPTAEKAATESLAFLLSGGRRPIFKKLANLAIELCGAGSAGISVIENTEAKSVFRWQALAGLIEPYEGGETPRNWSPCGTCLLHGKPVLYARPERYFTYLQALGMPLFEVLIIPMFANGADGATIWIVSHNESCRFDAEDVRVMTSLGAFATRALSLGIVGLEEGALAGEGGTELSAPDGVADRNVIWRSYLQRIAQGDDFALGALYRETSPLVFAAALRVLGFRADAEEVTADVYARIWRVGRQYDEQRGGVAPWLRTITRRLAFDRLRSGALRARFETPLLSDHCSAIDLDRDLMLGQAREQIKAALGALPRAQREAIEMAYFSSLSCPEIAARVGEPVGTVKTRIRLGLIKLRRVLAVVS